MNTFQFLYHKNYRLILQEVDLIPNGSKIEVTQENKMKYLDALAQYKLHSRASAEIESFIKGITVLMLSKTLYLKTCRIDFELVIVVRIVGIIGAMNHWVWV